MSENIPALAPNVENAVSFLTTYAPEGPWCLTAADPERKGIATATFSEVAPMRTWILEHNASRRWGVYFHVNPVAAPVSKKPSKEQIAAVTHFHVDVDPKEDADLAGEQQRILGLLSTGLKTKGLPVPTFVTFSGGGYQAFWRLAEPLPLDGTVATADDASLYSKRIEALLGADHCHNVDRLMRLPGTINWPSEKKRARGQQPVLARLVQDNVAAGAIYPLSTFAKAESAPVADKASVEVPINAPRVTDLSTLAVPDRIKVIIERGHDPDTPKAKDNSRSAWLFDALCGMARAGIEPATMFAIVTDPAWGISASVLDKGRDATAYAQRQIARATLKAEAQIVIEPGAPLTVAREFVRREQPHLTYVNGEYLAFNERHYEPMAREHLQAELTRWLETCFQWVGKGDERRLVQVNPNPGMRGAVFGMLQDAVFHPGSDLPMWRGDDPWHPLDVLLLDNCLLNARTGETRSHTPGFLGTNFIPVAYDPSAMCPTWQRCLDQWWAGQPEELAVLQEWFGLNLTADTSFHKALIVKGEKRSGKGTMTWVLESLVGKSNVCNPTLTALGDRFGLEPLLHKLVAIVGDARQAASGSRILLTERLLGVIGEDPQIVDRKGIAALPSVLLRTRFTILSNEVPTFSDSSGVVASRFLLLIQKPSVSFFGKEDHDLKSKLALELPGILNWALAGLARLRERGRFVVPEASETAARDMEIAGSSFLGWWSKATSADATCDVEKETLYPHYAAWCSANGYAAEASGKFWQRIKDKEAKGEIAEIKLRQRERRVRVLRGRALDACDIADLAERCEAEARKCGGPGDPYAAYRQEPCGLSNCDARCRAFPF